MPRKNARDGWQVGKYTLLRIDRSPFWHYRYWDPARDQTITKSLGTLDEDEAKRLLSSLALAEEAQDGPIPDTQVLLSTLLDTYYDDHAKQLPSFDDARRSIKRWKEVLGEITVDRLNPARFHALIQHLTKLGLAKSSIQRTLSVGKAALFYARKTGIIDTVPYIPSVETARDKRNRAKKGRVLEIDEFARLFVSTDKEHVRVFMMIMGNTLCRPESALELGPAQINLRHNRIDLNPPGNVQDDKFRPIVPLTNALRPYVERSDVRTFVNWKGEPLTSIKTAWRKMVGYSGLPRPDEIVPYSIRHTLPYELGIRGIDDPNIGMFLGHLPTGSAATTAIYKPMRPEYLREAVKAVDAYFAELALEIERQRPSAPKIRKGGYGPKNRGATLREGKQAA